jgi:hypothetical protein
MGNKGYIASYILVLGSSLRQCWIFSGYQKVLYIYIYIYKFLFSETPALGTDLEKTLKAKEPDFETPGTSRFFDSLSFSKIPRSSRFFDSLSFSKIPRSSRFFASLSF